MSAPFPAFIYRAGVCQLKLVLCKLMLLVIGFRSTFWAFRSMGMGMERISFAVLESLSFLIRAFCLYAFIGIRANAEASEPSYLCVGDQSVGFKDKKIDTKRVWEPANFKPSKYIFRPLSDSDFLDDKWRASTEYVVNGSRHRKNALFLFGRPDVPLFACHRDPFVYPKLGTMTCKSMGTPFEINMKALVSQIYFSGTYYFALPAKEGDRSQATLLKSAPVHPYSRSDF